MKKRLERMNDYRTGQEEAEVNNRRHIPLSNLSTILMFRLTGDLEKEIELRKTYKGRLINAQKVASDSAVVIILNTFSSFSSSHAFTLHNKSSRFEIFWLTFCNLVAIYLYLVYKTATIGATMRTDIELVEVPEKFKLVLGEPDPGTHNYKAFGTEEESDIWYDVFEELVPENGYSPGGAAGYVGVSRTAVHKRIKEGRLSAFAYYNVTKSIFHSKQVKLENGSKTPSMVLIPFSELKQWREIIREKKRKGEKLNLPKHPKDFGHDDVWATPGNWREKLGIKDRK